MDVSGADTVLAGTVVSVGSLVAVAVAGSVGASVGEVEGVFVTSATMVGVTSTFPVPHPARRKEKIKITLNTTVLFIMDKPLFVLYAIREIDIPLHTPSVHDLLVTQVL
jgi:hypothetical protein